MDIELRGEQPGVSGYRNAEWTEGASCIKWVVGNAALPAGAWPGQEGRVIGGLFLV